MFPRFPKLKNIAYAFFIIVIGIWFHGCWSTHRVFRPLKREQPITLFDKYRLNIYGSAEGWHNIICEISFIHKMHNTINVDSIPIFIIDSLCFYGDCLDSSLCYHPQLWSELFPSADSAKTGAKYNSSFKDIYIKDGVYALRDYYLENTLRLPAICQDTNIAVEIRGLLMDRTTSKEIDRESKRIRFIIKNETKMDIGY